ncbi:unnamed protein product [Cuscuta campestris]|uniref:F-box domain-containing protein n=1 Tax=Cuscuta campestris TaxID=132261 RepID=A0A484LKK7_9ASTE|nr:unnamed protein product [Cuscuta campestris]
MNEDVLVPEEVMIQILARLPVRSLVRARCVCKLWLALIRDTYFFRLYSDVSLRNPLVLLDAGGLFCVDRRRGVSELSLDFLGDRVKVRASCNGLLCCSSIPDRGVYYVCNPMTREFKLLPKTSRERHATRFSPDGEATLVALACDMPTLHFRVVLACYHRPRRDFVCSVYDSRSNKLTKSVSVHAHEQEPARFCQRGTALVDGRGFLRAGPGFECWGVEADPSPP